MTGDRLQIAVIGGGIIGLAVGWRLARDGHRVVVHDAGAAGGGASRVAGGMLAPVSEYGFDHDDFYAFGARSLERYPSFLRELEEDGGAPVALRTDGTLMVALDRDDAEAIRRLFRFREGRGLPVTWLTGGEARELEPLLSPRVSAAMSIPDDYEIDNRALVVSLATAMQARGGRIEEHARVDSIAIENDRATGVITAGGLEKADLVVLAAGAHSGEIGGLPPGTKPPVRPVKGQIVSLRRDDERCPLGRVVRTPDCYLVPKSDGRLLVGATEEEMGFDTTPTAGPVMRLIERAWLAVPAIYDLPIENIEVGLRPGTRDHLPVIGASSVAGLVMATGHYRHGILMAPATADAVAHGIREGFADDMSPFAPARFEEKARRDGIAR